jgi:hypothetical protein
VTYSQKTRIVKSQKSAVTRQRPVNNSNGVFCAVRADGCVRNNGIRHAITKQQLHINRGEVFSTRSVPICYKQGNLGRGLWGFSRELWLLKAASSGRETVREPRRGRTSAVGNRYQVTAVKT